MPIVPTYVWLISLARRYFDNYVSRTAPTARISDLEDERRIHSA